MFWILLVSTWVSEDLTSIGAGALVSQGVVSYLVAVSACFLGILIGDGCLFLAGKYVGQKLVRKAPFKWMIKEVDLKRSEHWLRQKGVWVIVVSRFTPGTRVPTYIGAGVLNMPFKRFIGYFCLATLLWTPALVALSMAFGEVLNSQFEHYQHWSVVLVLGTVLGVFALVKIVVPLCSQRGRRLLYAAWMRKIKWEFWSPWMFYPPVFVYGLYLGVKHRCLTLFTAANPGIPGGGVIGESKYDILKHFFRQKEYVAQTGFLAKADPVHKKIEQIHAFMMQHQLQFPIVLKPNSGERGTDVKIVKTEGEVRHYLEQSNKDVLVQEYISGQEFGVFYMRYPQSSKGFIFSITEKQLIQLVGDGTKSLEELILSHPRAVLMAPFHFKKHEQNLDKVIPKGQEVSLVELGSHCRGAVFKDGMWAWSPELEQKIDQLSRGFEGFFFGRYDIRTANIDDFKQGKNFKILELNGVTSESTNIYDPKHSLVQAYRILFKQWRLAFEIGAMNRARGHRPQPLGQYLAQF